MTALLAAAALWLAGLFCRLWHRASALDLVCGGGLPRSWTIGTWLMRGGLLLGALQLCRMTSDALSDEPLSWAGSGPVLVALVFAAALAYTIGLTQATLRQERRSSLGDMQMLTGCLDCSPDEQTRDTILQHFYLAGRITMNEDYALAKKYGVQRRVDWFHAHTSLGRPAAYDD
jgi:hypothetical protein